MTRRARRRLAPLLRSIDPPDTTMRPSSMLSVISASSSACSAARGAGAAHPHDQRVDAVAERAYGEPGEEHRDEEHVGDQRFPGNGSPSSPTVGPTPARGQHQRSDTEAEGVQGRRGRSGTGRRTRRTAASGGTRSAAAGGVGSPRPPLRDGPQRTIKLGAVSARALGATRWVCHSHARWPMHPTTRMPVKCRAEPRQRDPGSQRRPSAHTPRAPRRAPATLPRTPRHT